MTDILMPALSPTMEEGTLAKWLVKEGDQVSAGQVIAEIETDKATMEVEAVDEGVVEALLVSEGAEGVKVNAPIARLKGEDSSPVAQTTGEGDREAVEGAAAPHLSSSATSESPQSSPRVELEATTAPPEGEQTTASPRVGETAERGEAGGRTLAAQRPEGEHEAGSALMTDAGVVPPPPGNPVAPPATAAPLQSSPRVEPEATTAPPRGEQAPGPSSPPPQAERGGGGGASDEAARDGGGSEGAEPGRIFASPLARRLAQQAGLHLASIKGSGPHGRIVKADIEAALAAAPSAPAQPATPATPPPPAAGPAAQARSLEQMGIEPGSYRLIPLDNIRRITAQRLTAAFRDIPHFPLSIDLEIDRLLDARARINALLEPAGVKVSVNDLVMKAAALALTRVPEANASFTPEGIALHAHADIAMAVAIPGGLITPVIRQAETKGLAQIATEAKDLAARARDKKLKPHEFQGGTFSVSNLGMFGVKSFASVINEPGACILSIGAGMPAPIVRDDALAVATVMNVTLTCDHRAVDGATGARFLQAFKPLVEDPVAMLA